MFLLEAKSAFDLNRLKDAESITPPELQLTEPKEFITNAWLDDAVQTVEESFLKYDTDAERVPVLGLIRCSRGGKTRALKEIGRAMKAKWPDVAVIYVSFNDYSSIEPDEKEDLVTALCLRIAFAGLKDNDPARRESSEKELSASFGDFKSANRVSKSDIITWLRKKPCLLLIDELNIGTRNASSDSKQMLYLFLKRYFLSGASRYFVFSSHIISTASEAREYLDTTSHRVLILKWLPRILDLASVSSSLHLNCRLTALRAIYNGLIPSLILQPEMTVFGKRDDVVSSLNDQACTDYYAVRLFKNFVSGKKDLVLPELLQFMDVSGEKTLWIPRHMEPFIKTFALSDESTVSSWRKEILKEIYYTFKSFGELCDEESKAWEILFKTVILIRLFGGLYDKVLLPLDEEIFKNCIVSYNSYIIGTPQSWKKLQQPK